MGNQYVPGWQDGVACGVLEDYPGADKIIAEKVLPDAARVSMLLDLE